MTLAPLLSEFMLCGPLRHPILFNHKPQKEALAITEFNYRVNRYDTYVQQELQKVETLNTAKILVHRMA